MDIKELDDQPIPWNLLLMADPSKENVEKYLKDGKVFVANDSNQIIGVYVLVFNDSDEAELKNIAVDEKFQGQGIGKKLVLDAAEKAKSLGAKKITVGTGNSSLSQLALYQKCGFKLKGIDKGFFLRNYPEEIIENGIKCEDMILLEQEL